MFFHSLFTCAVSAGHVEITDHTFDYAYQNHAHAEHQSDSYDRFESDHQHQFHAHISCITGYATFNPEAPSPTLAIAHQLLPFDSNDNQPPVPPPNS
ncbi:hypothetical protein J6J08_11860 [Pseudidiomarina sp. 1APR75-33.1]|nr:hypothetical protein [Pseudidiomarina sp. 1APR75-33.1]MDN7128069.1 hypothetical protein [Pseudidiomarina sp. 1APR75-33.1]